MSQDDYCRCAACRLDKHKRMEGIIVQLMREVTKCMEEMNRLAREEPEMTEKNGQAHCKKFDDEVLKKYDEQQKNEGNDGDKGR